MAESDPDEWFAVGHLDEIIQGPSWADVPELSEDAKSKIESEIPRIIPGMLENGARRRFEVIEELCYHFVRFRRAGCSQSNSSRLARKMVCDNCGVTKQTLSGHITNLELTDSKSMSDYLEEVFHSYMNNRTETTEIVWELCHNVVDVVSVVAEIEKAPPIATSEISYQDVYQDQPDKRDSIFHESDDAIAQDWLEFDREASIQEPVRSHSSGDLVDRIQGTEEYLGDDVKVRTRDITTYNTEYSQVMFKIATSVIENMTLWSKQKLNPIIGGGGDDNSAIRGAIDYPAEIDSSQYDKFATFRVWYWEKGTSKVSVDIHPLGRIFDDKDPSLKGSIEDISKPGLHTLIGYTIKLAENRAFATNQVD